MPVLNELPASSPLALLRKEINQKGSRPCVSQERQIQMQSESALPRTIQTILWNFKKAKSFNGEKYCASLAMSCRCYCVFVAWDAASWASIWRRSATPDLFEEWEREVMHSSKGNKQHFKQLPVQMRTVSCGFLFFQLTLSVLMWVSCNAFRRDCSFDESEKIFSTDS